MNWSYRSWLEAVARDFRFSLRSLRRAPEFTTAVIATLALCIGPNVAILTLLYGLVLKPQPYHEPQQLVQVLNAFDKIGGGGSRRISSPPQFRDYQANADLFAGFAMMQYFGTTIGEDSTPERGTGMRVDAGFFPLFGVQPLLGRFHLTDEDVEGRDRVLVLTETFWRSRYAADPKIIGREIRMGGESWTIIGVAPKSVEGLDPYTMFFKPFERRASDEEPRARYRGRTVVYGRLKPGVSLSAAQAQLMQLEEHFTSTQANAAVRAQLEKSGHRVVLERLGEAQAAAVRTPLAMLQGGALFVLLIGVVNVLNLILARANAKRPERQIRAALGAGRGALLRQALAESLVLTSISCVLGLALAWASLRVINTYLPLVAAKAMPVSLETPVVSMIVLASVVLGIILAVVPSLSMGRGEAGLGAARTTSSSVGARAFGNTLIILQVAIALVLLVGAGLLVRSFVRVLSVDLGFDARQVVQGRVAVGASYSEPDKNVAMQRRITDAFREIPGVEQVAHVTDYAIGGSFNTAPFLLRGAEGQNTDNPPLAALNWVSPEFFPTMGVRLLEGRLFTGSDDRRKGLVVVVDDLFVKRYFPDRSAVGQELVFGTTAPPAGVPWPRIVGVVRRAQLAGPEARDGLPFIYGPVGQEPGPGFTFLVRSPRSSSDVLRAMRQKLREIDPTMPLYWTASLQEGLEGMRQFRRGLLLLISAFAVLALLLAGVGLYGVLTYDVSQRTREIGVRGAIGASPGQIVAMILKQGLWKAGIGVAAGLIGAAYLTRFIRAMLFDVTTFDPLATLSVSALLLAVAALACWLPARRAARVDPVIALRAE